MVKKIPGYFFLTEQKIPKQFHNSGILLKTRKKFRNCWNEKKSCTTQVQGYGSGPGLWIRVRLAYLDLVILKTTLKAGKIRVINLPKKWTFVGQPKTALTQPNF